MRYALLWTYIRCFAQHHGQPSSLILHLCVWCKSVVMTTLSALGACHMPCFLIAYCSCVLYHSLHNIKVCWVYIILIRTYVMLQCDTCNCDILILHSLLMLLECQAYIALHDACRFCKKHLAAAMYTWSSSVMPTQSSLTTYSKLKAYRYSMTHASDLFSGVLQPSDSFVAYACWHHLTALMQDPHWHCCRA